MTSTAEVARVGHGTRNATAAQKVRAAGAREARNTADGALVAVGAAAAVTTARESSREEVVDIFGIDGLAVSTELLDTTAQ